MYRECKEICYAAERGDSDISDDTRANTNDKLKVDIYPDITLAHTKLTVSDKSHEQSEQNKIDGRQQKSRGRPRLTSFEKEQKRLAKERGEAVILKGQFGKEYELVFDTSGKAIGKKDAEGNFFPYKARGRPVIKGLKQQSEL